MTSQAVSSDTSMTTLIIMHLPLQHKLRNTSRHKLLVMDGPKPSSLQDRIKALNKSGHISPVNQQARTNYEYAKPNVAVSQVKNEEVSDLMILYCCLKLHTFQTSNA